MESYSNSNTQHPPHARVRVINIADYDAIVRTKEQKMSDDCLTPKKKPAKTIFKKPPNVFKKDDKKTTTSPRTARAVREAAGIKDLLPIPPSPNDEALSDFLKRINQARSASKKPHPASHQPHVHELKSSADAPPASPKTPNAFAMLPEYARYQEARFQRVLSRGNSMSNMSPTTKSPGFEWVDHRTSSTRSIHNAWDANTLVAEHAFPSSIFCHQREEYSPVQQAAAIAAMHQEYGYQYQNTGYPSQAELREMALFDYLNRRAFYDNASIPSAAALSSGSSSSWSEDEEQRHFMEYMSHGASQYAHQQHHQQQLHSRHQLQRWEETQEAPPMVEIAPGVHEPLRKADETVLAVRHDFYVPVSCFGCSEDIFCIADAKYVICPTCRVVSPIEEGALEGQELRQHGLGLGFSCENLFQIQSEIIQENC